MPFPIITDNAGTITKKTTSKKPIASKFPVIGGDTKQTPHAKQAEKNRKAFSKLWTPIDYILQGGEYAIAGAMEKGFENITKLQKEGKAKGNEPDIFELIKASQFNPMVAIPGAAENLKAENRKTLPDVINRGLTEKGYDPKSNLVRGGTALAFTGSFATPSIPVTKVAKPFVKPVAKLMKGSKVVEKVATSPVVTKMKEKAVETFKYRGGQPKEYIEQAEALRKAERVVNDQAKEVGELLSKGLSRGEQIRLGQIIRGGEVTTKTSKELIRRATEARKIIDDLSQQVVNEAMRGGGTQVTTSGLASELLNTLTKNFKKPDPTLGITEKGWRTGDELAMDLVNVFKKYQPAHKGEMVDKVVDTAGGGQKTIKTFTDIGADSRGVIRDTSGGEEIVTSRLNPDDAVPFGGTVHAPEDAVAPSAFTQTSEGVTNTTAPLRVSKGVAEGLPQKPTKRRDLLPVETVEVDATSGGLRVSDKMVQTIEANMGKYLPRLYRKYEKDPAGLIKFLNTGQGKIVRDRLLRRSDIPGDVRAAMGEILEPAYPAAKGVQQMGTMVAKSKFFRWVNDNFAQADNVNLSDDLLQIPDAPSYGILAGKWVPASIQKDLISAFSKGTEGAFKKGYRRALGAWKTGKVLLNPAARARNQVSNMMLMDIVGGMPTHEVFNPSRWIDGILELKHKGPVYKMLKEQTSLLDETFVGNEIAPFLDEFSQLQGNALIRLLRASNKFVGNTYQLQEQIGKITLAKYWMGQGKTAKEAAEIAEKALFDYSKIPNSIKMLRDAPMGFPFITFAYKATPAIGEQLLKNPKRIAKYARIGQETERQAEAAFGEADRDNLPDYMKNGSYLRLPFQSEGKDLYLDLNYILPWGNFTDTTNRMPEPQNPVYTLFADLGRNKNAFTQKEIFDPITDTKQGSGGIMTAGGYNLNANGTRKVADYVYKTLMPSFAPGGVNEDSFIRGGYSFQKVVDAFRQRPDYFGRLRDLPTVLTDVLLGLKATPVDYQSTQTINASKQQKQAQEIMRQIKVVSTDKRRFPDEKAREIQRLKERLYLLTGGQEEDEE